jgi:peptidoglycan/LPS O-acetylase OafA/YrhL
MNQGEAKRFNSTIIQAGRGIAAMLVVFYHAASMYALPKYGGTVAWGGAGEIGMHGVDFFFVLSGFIIFMAHRNDIGRPDRLKRYALRRAVRIYPVYWIFLIGFLLLVGIGLSTAPVATGAIDMLSSFSLVRLSSEKPPLWVAWTLFHEILFYTVFAVLIWSRLIGVVLMGAWIVVMIAMHASGYDRPTFWTVFHDAFNLEFFMGIAVAYFVGDLTKAVAKMTLLLGALMLAVTAYADVLLQLSQASGLYTLVYGVSFALILAGAVGMEMQGLVKSSGILQLIGAATFSIYLAHSMVISIIYRFVSKLHVPAQFGDFVPLGVGILAIAISAPLYWIIEKPVLSFLWVRLEKKRSIPIAGPVTV